jgi:hypothetical protein
VSRKEGKIGKGKTEARIRVKENIKHQQEEGGEGSMQNTTQPNPTPQKKYPTIETLPFRPRSSRLPAASPDQSTIENATLLLRGGSRRFNKTERPSKSTSISASRVAKTRGAKFARPVECIIIIESSALGSLINV